ncbi:MAG: hypothetical protein NT062_27065 [Proteobacteria bacterium]|nr:hypothetical protein [Pseudomonadota bacterium]
MGRAGILVAGLVGLGACADPVVDLSFTSPAPAFDDTSCVTSVELYAAGKTYPVDPRDFVGTTVQVDHPPTYADLIAALRGKFDVPVPPTGLGAIEVYGWNGDPSWDQQLAPSELVFYARTPYDGDDVNLQLIPNVSCKRSTVTVRPLDLVGFITGNYQCAAGAIPDGVPPNKPFADLGTFAPVLYLDDQVRYFGGKSRGDVVGGVATIEGPTTVGPGSCLAIGTYTGTQDAIACARTAGICGHPGELEVAVLPDDFIVPMDPSATYSRAVVGGVFSTMRTPVAGAKVEVDPTEAKVAYLDLDVATKTFKIVSGQATSASGLFVVYTNKLVDVQVTSNGKVAGVQVGSIGDDLVAEYLATTIVVMP